MFLHSKKLGMALVLTAVGCSPGAGPMGGDGSNGSLFAPKPSNVRFSLTDAPMASVKSVFVNVSHVELLLERGGKQGRLLIAKDLGLVDLLTLQNGVTLALADIDMPDQVSVKQIRLVLNGDQNHLVKDNGDTCDLQTPSAQKSGIKILLSQPIVFQSGYSYSMVVDFDVHHSIVLKGNGGCLLKPVLKLKSANRVPEEQVGDDGSSDNPGEDVGSGDTNDPNTGGGFDNGGTGDTGGGTGDTGGGAGDTSGGTGDGTCSADPNVPCVDVIPTAAEIGNYI
jgi:hypothetical protein